MKRLWVTLILSGLMLLFGCGEDGTQTDAKEAEKVLTRALEIVSNANSFEYSVQTVEQTQFGDKIVQSDSKMETKKISEPLVIWGKQDRMLIRKDGEKDRTIFETYQTAENNRFVFYLRNSMEAEYTEQEPPLSDWQETINTDKAQIEMTLEYAKDLQAAQLYLFSANIKSFRFAEESETEGEPVLRYDGFIDPVTALEAYKTYLRDNFVLFHWVEEKKDLSLDDLKKEITSGTVAELRSGIPQYAYADEPVPFSLWIEKDTYELKRAEIDKTAMMQNLLEQELPKINPESEPAVALKHHVTYIIKGIDTLKEIKKPE